MTIAGDTAREGLAATMMRELEKRRFVQPESGRYLLTQSAAFDAFVATMESVESLPPQGAGAEILNHKWLDPKCIEQGCQSLVWQGLYESAVKGRQEFRQAFRQEREANHGAGQEAGEGDLPHLKDHVDEGEEGLSDVADVLRGLGNEEVSQELFAGSDLYLRFTDCKIVSREWRS